jgi:hypothetical protein
MLVWHALPLEWHWLQIVGSYDQLCEASDASRLA